MYGFIRYKLCTVYERRKPGGKYFTMDIKVDVKVISGTITCLRWVGEVVVIGKP